MLLLLFVVVTAWLSGGRTADDFAPPPPKSNMGENEKKPSHSNGGYYKKKWNNNKKKQHGAKTATPARSDKFLGGKEELGGNYFDCTGYGQSDRFVKTVQKIADYVGQEYKCGGISRTEVMTQKVVSIPMPIRPVAITSITAGVTTTTPPDVLDISDYQSDKKAVDYKILHQKVHETKAAFYRLKQGKDSDQDYQIKFLNTVQVIEQCGLSLGEDPMIRAMVCKDLSYQEDTTSATEITEISKTVRDYTLGAALILGADPSRYSNMIRGLKNASLAGRDEWPKNVTEAYNYLSKWETDEPSDRHERDYEGSSFLNDQEKKRRRNTQMVPRTG